MIGKNYNTKNKLLIQFLHNNLQPKRLNMKDLINNKYILIVGTNLLLTKFYSKDYFTVTTKEMNGIYEFKEGICTSFKNLLIIKTIQLT